MKVSELRIGNWVRTNKEEKVVDVMCDSINTHDKEGLPYDHIYPIPLTEEWLEKFGFKKHMEWVWLIPAMNNVVIRVSVGTKTADLIRNINVLTLDIECKYVHQLQNLYFALTGEELENNSPDQPVQPGEEHP